MPLDLNSRAALADVVSELDVGQSLAELTATIKARRITVSGLAQSGKVLAYLASIGKISALEDISNDASNPLRDAAKAAMITLQFREGFDFSIPETFALLQAFGSGGANILTTEQINAIKAIGDTTVPEFSGVDEIDVLEVR